MGCGPSVASPREAAGTEQADGSVVPLDAVRPAPTSGPGQASPETEAAAYTRSYEGAETEEERHTKARGQHPQYPPRTPVDDESVPWSRASPGYEPVDFTHPVVKKFDCTKMSGGWADPEDWRAAEGLGLRERMTYETPKICFLADGPPRNPRGRTGMRGRGLLGKWGPNHAADPIVTRYSPTSGELEMVAILRGDTKEWAIPGGMVDAGETVSVTVKREFEEEAGNVPEEQRAQFKAMLDTLFKDPGVDKEVYRGYVDDPRNTDNAWMETCAMHFHCPSELGAAMPLHAGDDATAVRWLRVDPADAGEGGFQKLYGSHVAMVLKAVEGMELKRSKDEATATQP